MTHPNIVKMAECEHGGIEIERKPGGWRVSCPHCKAGGGPAATTKIAVDDLDKQVKDARKRVAKGF